MANLKASLKDIRKIRTLTNHNRTVRSELKTLVKNFRAAKNEDDKEATKAIARKLVSAMDKAAKRHIVHPNLARRHKVACAPYI